MTMSPKLVPEIIKEMSSDLTNSERKVADVLLQNHPLSGLGGITDLAQKAGVSTPTVTRLVDKLGFYGYAEFQQALKAELDEKMSQEILGGKPWAEKISETNVLNHFGQSVMMNVRKTIEDIDIDALEDISQLLSDLNSAVYILGGRITSSIADHLYKYIRVLRPDTSLLNQTGNSWHNCFIDLKKDDVLIIYDIRRYEADLFTAAKIAKEAGAKIILLTDQVQSPIADFATYTINGRIMMPNNRNSLISHLLLNEIIIFQLQNNLGDVAKERWNKLEDIFQKEKFFHK